MSFWIFKSNPKIYRLKDRVEDPRPDLTWTVSRYRKRILPGDTVFLMETGKPRMFRAVVEVLTAPQEMAELEAERDYWVEPETVERWRIQGRIVHRIELPLDDLVGIAGLENLSILRGFQQATNFPVSDEEGAIILGLATGASAEVSES